MDCIGRIAHLKEKIAKVKQQTQALEAIGAEMKTSEDGQISLTDPDSRSMATSGRGTGIEGYNVQTAVDADGTNIDLDVVASVLREPEGADDLGDAAIAKVVLACKRATRSNSLVSRLKICADAYMVCRGGIRHDLQLRHLLHDWLPLCRTFDTAKDMRKHVRDLMKSQRVATLTVHNAKGCEWHQVFVFGSADSVLPHYRATTSDLRIQELQTLFVAAPRATAQLTLAYAPTTVLAKGYRKHFDAQKLSRFLSHDSVLSTLDVKDDHSTRA